MSVLLIIVACLIIITTLLQSDKAEGIANAFSGGLSLFSNHKERGNEKILPQITAVLAILFFVLILLAHLFN